MNDHRPTVILAGFGRVDLVAAARAIFHFPQASRGRIDGKALFTAMTAGPDFGQHPRFADERIVRRGIAVRRDVDHLAKIGVQSLRHVPRR